MKKKSCTIRYLVSQHSGSSIFGALSLQLQFNGMQILYIIIYYIDTDEIPGFFLLLKNHIFITCSEDTIFIFHV